MMHGRFPWVPISLAERNGTVSLLSLKTVLTSMLVFARDELADHSHRFVRAELRLATAIFEPSISKRQAPVPRESQRAREREEGV